MISNYTQDAVALCGLPGAGKSYVADILAEVYDTETVSMGDAIRESFKQNQSRRMNSETLANYAASWRKEDFKGIPKKVAEIAEELGDEVIVIDGVRSDTDVEVLREEFDKFHLIEIKAEFYHRLSRLQERGREGEEAFNAVDLAERDIHEKEELGFAKTKEKGYIDISTRNGTGLDNIEYRLLSIVENNLPHSIENYEPLGTTEEQQEMINNSPLF